MLGRILIVILLNCGFIAYGQSVDRNHYQRQLTFQKIDSLVTSDIYLLSDTLNRPQLYASNLSSGVCEDDLCRPVNITIYWDLLGNFVDYQTPPSDPLTKFDHIKFTAADHKKLHKILADTNSLLRDYAPEDMVDKRIAVRSATTDAVTGATIKSFEDDIVSGAVYTVHTLWHFVNGEIPAKILRNTGQLMNDNVISQFLDSGNPVYQTYVLQQLQEEHLLRFKEDVFKLMLSHDVYVPHYAIAKLPADLWANTKVQSWIVENFAKTTFTVQNALLEKLVEQRVGLRALKMLVDLIPAMPESQIDKSFSILTHNINIVDRTIIDKLTNLKTNESKHLTELATQFLNRVKL